MSKERKKAPRKTASPRARKKAAAALNEKALDPAQLEGGPSGAETRAAVTRGRKPKAARRPKAVETEAEVLDEPTARIEVEEADDDDRGPVVVTDPIAETWASDARPGTRRRRATRPAQEPADAPRGAVVEKRRDAVVLRFPPAAPPPFEPNAPMPAPDPVRIEAPAARHAETRPHRELRPVQEDAPPSRAEANEDAPADRAPASEGRRRRGRRGGRGRGRDRDRTEGRGDATQSTQPSDESTGTFRRVDDQDAPDAEVEPTADDAADAGLDGDIGFMSAEAYQKLSPSQKRRLRRKRRQASRDNGPAGATPRPSNAAEPEMRTGKPGHAHRDERDQKNRTRDEERGQPAAREERPRRPAGDRPPQRGEERGQATDERRSQRGERDNEDRGGRRRRGRGRDRGRGRWRDREFDRDQPTEIPDTGLEPPIDDGDVAPTVDADTEAEFDFEERVEAVVPEPDVAAEIDVSEEEDEDVATTGGHREMLINAMPLDESRIAVLNEGKLEEIYIERRSSENHVWNIYKGVITNVEPSIQAAFIDFGLGKNGFLHISDLHPRFFPHGGRETENVGRKTPRRHRPPIQRCLRRGQELIVQITKEGIGTKGPTLTTYLSIPGRFLVMMPGMARLGVSRKVEDDKLRDTIRDLLSELELPDGMGFIARTAAVGRSRKELQSDLNYLLRLWRAVERRISEQRAPAELYRESDLVIRTIRDVFTDDISRIVVDDPKVAEQARQFLATFNPRAADLVQDYNDPEPLFHRHGIEAELERLHSRHVPLPAGGSLVIDQTEALVAIDVNSGRYRTEDDAETTAYKINLEAADEIPRQLRLRDLGGVIICDFIDMREERHRREIERRLVRNLKQHKERAKVLRMSSFGIIELTRQRQRASLTRSVYQDCTHCRGTGLVKSSESVTLDVIRQIQLAVTRDQVTTIEVTVSPDVAQQIQNRKRALLHDLETEYRRTIWIRPDNAYGLDQVQIQCFDTRGRPVAHQ